MSTRRAPEGLPIAPRQRSLIFAACMMATFMAAVESTIVATAMPTIVADLGEFRLFTWVFGAYLLTQAVSVPIYGRLADLYGRKRIFFAGAGLFLVGSTLCGFARGMLTLILFRAVQGAGAGAVQPLAYTIVGDIYTPTERARLQGLLSGVFGVAAVVGPSLGAFLVQEASWPVVFWVNLPIGAAAIVMIALFLHEEPPARRHQIDYQGSLLLLLGGGLVMTALVGAASFGRATVALFAGGGGAALGLLLWHERRVPEPMLPLSLWRNRVVALGSLGGFTIGAIMIGVAGFLPSYVQGVMGRSAGTAGAALGAMSVSWAVASVLAGRVMIRTSFRLTAIIGSLTLIIGSAALIAMSPRSGPLWAGMGALLIGIGMGFCNTTYLVSVQAAVSMRERGAATASSMFMRLVGQAGGAALFGAVLNAGMLRRVPHADVAVERLMDPALREGLGAAEVARLSAAMAGALAHVYLISAVLGVLALGLAAALPARLSPTRTAGRG
jgi:EmrB/QacA subfamily drug resistance transporter